MSISISKENLEKLEVALNERFNDPENLDAFDMVHNALCDICKECGLESVEGFVRSAMEFEEFTGEYDFEAVVELLKDMIKEGLEDEESINDDFELIEL